MACLEDEQMQDLAELAEDLGMDVLVESHDAEELARALKLSTPLIGINNRNLSTVETNISHCENLLNRHHQVLKPQNIIAESGFTLKSQLDNYVNIGVNKFLIGEGLLRNTLL